MREIKFRGKRIIDGNEWVTGCLTRYSGKMGYITVDLIEDKVYRVDSATVGQFTGLKDKNGVDIYEGDNTRRWLKIRNKWEEVQPGVIKWIQCVSAFKCVDKDGLLHCFDNGHLYEVIGNIHSNPELLEVQS